MINNDLILSKLINNVLKCFEEPDFVFFRFEGGWMIFLYHIWYYSTSLLNNVFDPDF